jgi:hypothetical protein
MRTALQLHAAAWDTQNEHNSTPARYWRGRGAHPRKAEGHMTTPRQRKPRPPVIVRPSFVSQDSSPALLGLCARKFLDVLVPRCAGDVVRVGRTVLIPLDVAEGALQALSTGGDDNTNSTANDESAMPTSVDAVLASVGMRRSAGR